MSARPFRPRLILPFLVFVCLVMLGFRIDAAFDALQTGRAFHVRPPVALAEAPAVTATPDPAAAKGDKQKAAEPPASAAETATPAEADPPPAAEGIDPLPGDAEASDQSGLDLGVMKDLAKRRTDLAARSKALDAREALVAVAEKRVEQKIKEMETIRAQVQALLGQANAAQAAQIDNLVKIYETMKPKEAARIFETLDMPVLLGVVQKMKPARTAAVLAEMDPKKAKDITVALTKQDQLPQMK